ncbi:alpha/beta fold hydrolase [Saccharomonospora azurea]|uniref:alpha/beta fold hydrolase n=1 Tax=Saccharomonospora azurea TaxID=40988 RepID=UPI003D90035C
MELSGFTSTAARDRFTERYEQLLTTRWPPHTRATVATSFGPTAVVTAGDGPGLPAVLLAGGSANAATWAPLLPSLSADRPVIAVDVLGEAGGSTQTAPIPDAPNRARWLDEVLTGLGVDRAHLVGHSAGGAIALAQAVHHPSRLATVTALEPARALAPVRAIFFVRLLAVMLTGSRRRAAAYLRWCRGGKDVPSPVRELLASALVDHRSRAVPPPPRLSDEELSSITLPVLVALGADSPVHAVGIAARRARLVSNVAVHVVEGAAHGLFSERPEEVGQLVSEFLARHDADPDDGRNHRAGSPTA